MLLTLVKATQSSQKVCALHGVISQGTQNTCFFNISGISGLCKGGSILLKSCFKGFQKQGISILQLLGARKSPLLLLGNPIVELCIQNM